MLWPPRLEAATSLLPDDTLPRPDGERGRLSARAPSLALPALRWILGLFTPPLSRFAALPAPAWTPPGLVAALAASLFPGRCCRPCIVLLRTSAARSARAGSAVPRCLWISEARLRRLL